MRLSAALLLLFTPSLIVAEKGLVFDVEQVLHILLEESRRSTLPMLVVISAHTKLLFTIGTPVGDLLTASFNTTWEENSEEERALAKLHEGLKSYDDEMRARTAKFRGNTKLGAAYWKSLAFVELGARQTAENFEVIIALADRRRANATLSEAEFLQRCDDDHRPMLQYTLSESSKCVQPSAASIQPFIRAQRAFRRIEAAFPEGEATSDTTYLSIKHDILACMSFIAERDTLLGVLEAVDATTSQAAVQQLQGLQPHLRECSSASPDVHSTCLQEWFSMANEFGVRARSELINFIVGYILKSALFEIVCTRAEMTTPRVAALGDDYYWDARAAFVDQQERVFAALTAWYWKSAETSYPELGLEAALKAIGSSAVRVDESSAASIRAAFLSVSDDYLYGNIYEFHVAVADGSERNASWAALSLDRSHAHFSREKTDVHVFRTDGYANFRRHDAFFALRDKRARVEAVIRNHSSSDANAMLAELVGDPEIGPLVHKDLYRSMLVLRRKAFFSANTQISVGLAGPESQMVEVRTNGFFAYCWRVYFFL